MSEEQTQQPSTIDIVKQELRVLKDLREMLKAHTRVGPSDAATLAGVWQWLGMMINRSEQYIRDEKKSDET